MILLLYRIVDIVVGIVRQERVGKELGTKTYGHSALSTQSAQGHRRQPVTAAYVATVILRYPTERGAILRLLQAKRGLPFVRQVLQRVSHELDGKPTLRCGQRRTDGA